MKLVATKNEIIQNLETIERNLQSKDDEIYAKMARYIAWGKCFIAYLVNGQYHFAPSRFVGYAKNSLLAHDANTSKHGWDTNPAISGVVGHQNVFDENLDKAYLRYCEWLDVKPKNNKRSYWILDGDFVDVFSSPHFTEGARRLVVHEVSERNPKVVKVAKHIFKKEHDGELFCEICGFNFKTFYGKVGEDFIEAHHKVSLSSTTKEHKVKPSDLIMICPNCHRMLHRKVNGKFMSINQLQKALKKNGLN